FRQIGERVRGYGGRRRAVPLEPEPSALRARPGRERRDEPLVEQLRERLTPVVPQRSRIGWHIRDEHREVRREIVAAARAELLEEVRGPVRFVHFEAVAEDGVGRVRLERGDERLADEGEITIERRPVVMIEDESFGAEGGPFHHHAGPARDEEQDVLRALARGGELDDTLADVGDLGELAQIRGGGRRDKRGDETLA